MSLLANYNKSRNTGIGAPGPATFTMAEQGHPTPKKTRLKTWELPSMFHCSIVGTCLTTTELRQVMAKIGDIDARAATDHTLHSRGVQAAGQRGIAGKLLNKALDRRHETVLKRFSKLTSVEDIHSLWNECVDQGDISGAYWAVMAHPVTEKELMRQVFGEVHMLSHLVGSASRLDIARLQKLQTEAEAKDEKLARQERRLHELALQNHRLQRRIESIEAGVVRERAVPKSAERHLEEPVDGIRLLEKLDAAQAHAEDLASRHKAAELKWKAAEKRASVEAARNEALQRELASVESLMLSKSREPLCEQAPAGQRRAILYVGGRRSLFDHFRAVADGKQIELLLHDGGLEDSLSLLPGLVSQATGVVFPVDCISHSAAGLVKRLCRDSDKAYLPMRSASLASFAAAISEGYSEWWGSDDTASRRHRHAGDVLSG